MFYTLRRDNPDVDWAVLMLNSKIILDFDCGFCSTNAGSAEMYETPIEERKGEKALLKLFEELPNGPTRKELGIGDWYPTNPQAEVLVFDSIPTTYILKVFFQNESLKKKHQSIIPEFVEVSVSSRPFRYREDWSYWKKN
ncbi:DarT ssDNA thymidine ADP-ribosyltransferase family protein [Desulforamulus aquiferis]|uniref:DarT ssDNA thymidine ADP-ribosyltransferase family protein n=1 Tax=Desulforamulus aquiferis TaxID=1397668 RepID=A0AAW7ZJV7_9FIRM|nr:DarT ssDNA thymidine ADP-ribosyltransferase family protein [Desulforamulus aquiferis]MDO7789119.1 DarT ssDNA thymidine ADP-ribosyltransferase family protein [Desulforamulus aquiferis]